jgi:hypothetical protein
MKWNHIKIFLIILLVLVNAFFTVTLYNQYRTTNYIPDSELQQLTALLSRGSVEVPEGALPARKLDATVYGGSYADSYYEDTLNLLSGGGIMDAPKRFFLLALGLSGTPNAYVGALSMVMMAVVAAGLAFLLVRRAPIKEQER